MSVRNEWKGMGNLGQDPELKHTRGSGKAVCNFSVAVDEVYTTGTGANRRRVTSTAWIPVVAWGPLAENCAKYLKKGSQVLIAGRLSPRSYPDAQGNTQHVFEIVANDVEFLKNYRTRAEVEARTQTNTA